MGGRKVTNFDITVYIFVCLSLGFTFIGAAFAWETNRFVREELRWNENYPIECRLSSLAREGSWSDRIILHDVVEASRIEVIGTCQVLYLRDRLVASSCERNARIVCSKVGTFMESLRNGKDFNEGQTQSFSRSLSWAETE